jgi:hypothetical protein
MSNGGGTSGYAKSNKSAVTKKQNIFENRLAPPAIPVSSLTYGLTESDKQADEPYAFIKNMPKEQMKRLGEARIQQEKKEEGSLLNTIGNTILRYHPISLAAQYAAKKAVGKISENIDPYSYNTNEGGWGNRALNSFFNKEGNRKETEKLAAMGGEKSNEPRLRLDLLNMYAGKAQQYNSFSLSKEKPTQGNEANEKYYDSPSLKNEIYNTIAKKTNLIFTDKDDLKNKIFNSIGGKKGQSGNNISTTLPALGQGTLGVGEDEKGVYISYSDKWDINPSEGVSADYKTENSSLRNVLNFATKKAEEYGVVNPTKVYGRIYIDKKTGLPIKD